MRPGTKISRSWHDGGVRLLSTVSYADKTEIVADSTMHSVYLTLAGRSQRTDVWVEDRPIYTGREAAGVLSFVPAGAIRRAAYDDVHIRFASLRIAPENLSQYLPRSYQAASQILQAETNAKDMLAMGLICGLVEEARDEKRVDKLFVDSMLTTLAMHLVRRHSGLSRTITAPMPSLPAKRMRMVEEFIDANLSANIALADLANVIDLSLTQFVRSFRRAYGQSPYSFFLDRRINRAAELLATTDSPLTDIALEVGFANQSHFTKTFSKRMGMPPGSYRRSMLDR